MESSDTSSEYICLEEDINKLKNIMRNNDICDDYSKEIIYKTMTHMASKSNLTIDGACVIISSSVNINYDLFSVMNSLLNSTQISYKDKEELKKLKL